MPGSVSFLRAVADWVHLNSFADYASRELPVLEIGKAEWFIGLVFDVRGIRSCLWSCSCQEHEVISPLRREGKVRLSLRSHLGNLTATFYALYSLYFD